MSFVFSLNFSLILIFSCIKPIEKALFSRFCLSDIIVRPFVSLMGKFEVCSALASKLEHFENDIYISAKTFSIPLP